MKLITKERATLIAAIFAAIASLTTAFMANSASRTIAEYSVSATAELERLSFRRSQLDRLAASTLEAAVNLHTQFDASKNVRWIMANEEPTLIYNAARSIERIRYSLTNLVAMGVIQQEKLTNANDLLSSLLIDWEGFTSSRMSYRDAVKAGNIKKTGEASDKEAVKIEKRYLKEIERYSKHLNLLQELIGGIQSTISGERQTNN